MEYTKRFVWLVYQAIKPTNEVNTSVEDVRLQDVFLTTKRTCASITRLILLKIKKINFTDLVINTHVRLVFHKRLLYEFYFLTHEVVCLSPVINTHSTSV